MELLEKLIKALGELSKMTDETYKALLVIRDNLNKKLDDIRNNLTNDSDIAEFDNFKKLLLDSVKAGELMLIEALEKANEYEPKNPPSLDPVVDSGAAVVSDPSAHMDKSSSSDSDTKSAEHVAHSDSDRVSISTQTDDSGTFSRDVVPDNDTSASSHTTKTNTSKYTSTGTDSSKEYTDTSIDSTSSAPPSSSASTRKTVSSETSTSAGTDSAKKYTDLSIDSTSSAPPSSSASDRRPDSSGNSASAGTDSAKKYTDTNIDSASSARQSSSATSRATASSGSNADFSQPANAGLSGRKATSQNIDTNRNPSSNQPGRAGTSNFSDISQKPQADRTPGAVNRNNAGPDSPNSGNMRPPAASASASAPTPFGGGPAVRPQANRPSGAFAAQSNARPGATQQTPVGSAPPSNRHGNIATPGNANFPPGSPQAVQTSEPIYNLVCKKPKFMGTIIKVIRKNFKDDEKITVESILSKKVSLKILRGIIRAYGQELLKDPKVKKTLRELLVYINNIPKEKRTKEEQWTIGVINRRPDLKKELLS